MEDFEVAGLPIRGGTQVLMSQWVVQRDERWFREPERFRPERWLGAECADLPRFAYFPFGGGPRVCVGQHFALLELLLVVARIGQSCRFERLEEPLVPAPVITLRPSGPVNFRVRRRTPPNTAADRAAE
jgi:cytochrome P450